MIKFKLACDKGHEFESWFPDGASFETQARRGLVICAQCDSRNIVKAPMAPAVLAGRRDRAEPEAKPVALLDESSRELRAAVQELRRRIEAGTEDVGDRFPQIARAIHEGDEPERAIRGNASPAAARKLWEDGVDVFPLPALPDDAN